MSHLFADAVLDPVGPVTYSPTTQCLRCLSTQQVAPHGKTVASQMSETERIRHCLQLEAADLCRSLNIIGGHDEGCKSRMFLQLGREQVACIVKLTFVAMMKSSLQPRAANQFPTISSDLPTYSGRLGTGYISAVSMKLPPLPTLTSGSVLDMLCS